MKSEPSIFAKLFDSKALLIGGALLVVLFVSAFAKEFFRRYEIQREIVALEQEAATLETRQTELRGLVEYFQSDAYKESEARERLGLQKEGESVIIIPNAEETPHLIAPSSSSASAAKETERNIEKWWNYFFQS